jgi:hypothetical protein
MLKNIWKGTTELVGGVAGGAADIAAGGAGFILDAGKAASELFEGDVGEAAEIFYGSITEDLLGKTLMGAFGPEGIGGTLIGALPEQIRGPSRAVLTPTLEAWQWVIDEVVDRPLGTVFTVTNAATANGIGELFDFDTYKQAWEINDARTFGQAWAAGWMNPLTDPFDENEFNALRTDPIFNLLSGTVDFAQEFLDPVYYFLGTTYGVAKGTRAVSVGSRSLRRTGASRLPSASSDIIGVGGAGLRPSRILGKTAADRSNYNPVRVLSKNQKQMEKVWGEGDSLGGMVQAWKLESGKQFMQTPQWKAMQNALDDVQYAGKSDAAIAKRYAVINNAFGRMPEEAAAALASAETRKARDLVWRTVSGDVSAMGEAFDAVKLLKGKADDPDFRNRVGRHNEILARLAKDSAKSSKKRMSAKNRKRLQDELDELAPEVVPFNTALADIPFEAMFDLRSAFEMAQNRGVISGVGRFEVNDNFNLSFSSIDDANFNYEALNEMLERTDVFAGSATVGLIDELPYATPLQRVLQRYGDYAKNSVDDLHVDERLISRLVGPGSKRVRFFTSKLPHTTLDTRDPNAYQQFERMLREAGEVELPKVAGAQPVRLISQQEIGEALGRFQLYLERGLFDEGSYDAALKLFDDTETMLVKRFDDATEAVGLGNSTVGNLTEQINKAKGVYAAHSSEKALSVLPEGTVQIIRDGSDTAVNYFYGKMMSPSQISTTRVLHRWDLVSKELKRIQRIQRLPEFVQTPTQAARAGFQSAARGADSAMNVWKPLVLLTPKWPMRVSLDEQLRIAGTLGMVEGLGMLMKNMPNLSRTYAAKALTRKAPQALENTQDLTPIIKAIDDKLGRQFDKEATLLERLDEVAKLDNPDKWLQDVYRNLINDAMADNKARRAANASLKGGALSLVVNPFVGIGYGAISHYSRRRRMLQVAEINAKRTVADALQREGRDLMAEALQFADDVSPAVRAVMVEQAANMIRKGKVVLDDVDKAAKMEKATNVMDRADEIMIDAGVPHLSVSGYRLTSVYGDERRGIEEVRRQVSSRNSVDAVARSVHGAASRELSQFFDGFKQYRYSEATAKEFTQQFERLADIFTPGQKKEFSDFYDIVWGNQAIDVRAAMLADLFKKNDALRRRMGVMPDDDLASVSKAMVLNYDGILPANYGGGVFLKKRSEVANGGELKWKDIEDILEQHSKDNKLGKTVPEMVDDVQSQHLGFGVTLAPNNSPKGTGLGDSIRRKTDYAFDLLGTQVTDNIARNPYFQAIYEREVNRRMASMVDAAGDAVINQRAIMQIQKQSQKKAMQETRELLYELTEQTRFGEVVSNLMPFYNAWAEVFSRWAGIAIENPYFAANTYRLYQKPWDAEALGISEVTVEFGGEETDYLMFQWPTAAPTGENDVESIWSLMPKKVQELLTPAAVREMGGEIKMSKSGLATMLQSTTPGFGPLVTIPVQEALLRDPDLTEVTDFLFPFGHPEGGKLDRMIFAQLPAYAQSLRDLGMDTERNERVVQSMFVDYAVERAVANDPIDPTDLADVNAAIEIANERARVFHLFRVATGLFSPSSTTMASPYDELIQEARRLQSEYGSMEGNARFLSEYGEEFFTLTTRMTELNDGVAATVVNENEYIRLQDLVQAYPEIGAYISGSVGPLSEKAVFSQAVYRRQQQMQVSPSDPRMRRDRKSLLDTISDPQIELGWKAYSELQDAIRMEQSRREDAGLPSGLSHSSMASIKAYRDEQMALLADKYPAWARELNDFGSSAEKMSRVIEGFVAVSLDERMRSRPSYRHVLDYLDLRVAVQDELVRRSESGGSVSLTADSNEDLLFYFEQERELLADRPEFSQIFDRFFSRDMIVRQSFIGANDPIREFLGTL